MITNQLFVLSYQLSIIVISIYIHIYIYIYIYIRTQLNAQNDGNRAQPLNSFCNWQNLVIWAKVR